MKKPISPLSGWALDYVTELDQCSPGFAGMYLRSSNERRQVIAAHLATKLAMPDLATKREAATFLAQSDHCSMLFAAFGSVPSGMRGALRRSGPQPHDENFYRRLHNLLVAPPHAAFVRTLNHLPDIDADRLSIAASLRREVCCANVVNAISGPDEANQVEQVIEMLIQNGADKTALFESIRRVDGAKALRRVWKRWMLRSTFPAHPVPASERYFPVTSAIELRRLALRYQNCAENYVITALDGLDAFAEFVGVKKAMVIHLRRDAGDRWVIEGMFGRLNARPRPEHRAEALGYLSAHGVQAKPRKERRHGQWQMLRRLISTALFDYDDDDDD